MKKILIFLLFTNVFFISAQEENIYEVNYSNMKNNIIQFIKLDSFKPDLLNDILKNFKINEVNSNKNFYYPSNDVDYKNLWSFLQKLFLECQNDYRFILFYIELDSINLRNVELGEALSFDFYEVALESPTNILLAMKNMTTNQQDKLLSNLDMLIETNNVESFIDSIENIHSKDLNKYMDRIKIYFKDRF